LLRSIYSPFPAPLRLHVSFCAPLLRTDVTRHFILNPLLFAPTRSVSLHSHLASRVTIFTPYGQTTRLSPQTTRLRLRHLNKPGWRPSAVGGRALFLVLFLFVVPCLLFNDVINSLACVMYNHLGLNCPRTQDTPSSLPLSVK
jgi:hypothetical protein